MHVFKNYDNYIFNFRNLIFVLDFEFIKPPASGILDQAKFKEFEPWLKHCWFTL